MKSVLRIGYGVLLGSMIFFSSCKKLEDLTTFTITNTASFTIPGSGISLPGVIQTPGVQTSSDQSFANHNTSVNLVKNITLKSMDLHVTSPQGQGLGFLKSIKIYISADGQPEILLAQASDIPQSTGADLSLTTMDQSLDAYVKQSSYDLREELTFRNAPAQDTDIEAKMEFSVQAKLN